MARFLVPIASLLLSVAVLLIGHGLQLTLLPLRGEVLGWSAAEIGLTGSTYYLGFVVGCLTIPRIISRVGHIRTFAVLAAVATAVILIISLSQALLVWLGLRFFTGWALSGLYMVIESWLNERSPTELRGAILSLYAMLTMVATAAGQLFLAEADPAEATLFIVAALFMCLSILPVGLSVSVTPQPVHDVQFRPKKLFRTSQISVVGALLGGMVTGSFWALGPLYASARGLSAENVGLFMTAAIRGGAAFQFPLGRLSDWLYVLAFLFGATSMPLYALCVAHANDNITAVSYSVAAIWCIVRLRGHTASRSHFQPYAPLPETTQCVIDLDPRKAA